MWPRALKFIKVVVNEGAE
jgi:hypothetical protein